MLAQDVRLALRLLIKDYLFTVATLTVLALAIGMITTIFTYVNAQILRDLPVPSPNRVISFGVRDNRGRDLPRSPMRISQTGVVRPTAFPGLPRSRPHTGG